MLAVASMGGEEVEIAGPSSPPGPQPPNELSMIPRIIEQTVERRDF
jgi:hypothetical protein